MTGTIREKKLRAKAGIAPKPKRVQTATGDRLTANGKRVEAALQEVLADVKGQKPLPMKAAFKSADNGLARLLSRRQTDISLARLLSGELVEWMNRNSSRMDWFKAMPDELKALQFALAEYNLEKADAGLEGAFGLFDRQSRLIDEMEQHILGALPEVLKRERAEINSLVREMHSREKSDIGKKGAAARHIRDIEKQKEIQKIWAKGNFESRDKCAEEEYEALGVSFRTARKALNNSPNPDPWPGRRK